MSLRLLLVAVLALPAAALAAYRVQAASVPQKTGEQASMGEGI
ncbi:MAG: hypothetical protein ABSG60_10270 [Terracidiphilus sp.]